MNIPQSSKLKLYSGVDVTAGTQVIFSSKSGQDAYFAAREKFATKMSSMNFSYIRYGRPIKVQLTTEEVAQCDYMSFINPDFENKMFYAKIIDYSYVNNKTTLITYAIDNFQTYMFDVNYESGFIENECLSVDEYNRGATNPFDPTLKKFRTPENFAFGKEFEDFYEITRYSLISSGVFDGDAAILAGSDNITDSKIIMQIADFDTAEVPYDQFLEYFSEVRASNLSPVVANGYTMYVMNSNGPLQDALNWLTFQGLSSQVIGIFQVSNTMWESYKNYSGGQTDFITFSTKPRQYNVTNKKLLLYPYQYIRIDNNEGDIKELRYEWFLNNVTHSAHINNECKLRYLPMFDGAPCSALVPENYKQFWEIGSSQLNINERIECHQFPQVGYTTDAYLTFLASQYQMNISSRTSNLAESANSAIDKWAAANDLYGKIKGPWGNLSGEGVRSLRGLASSFNSNVLSNLGEAAGNYSVNNIGGTVSNVVQAIGGLGSLTTADLRGEADTWRSGDNIMRSKMFDPSKGAYVADYYHPGSGNGTINGYANKLNAGVFTVYRVKIRDEYLKSADIYLSGYGYTFGEIGKPLVCKYIEGETTDENVPKFMNYMGKNVAYIKTSDMHVNHARSSVVSDIEAIFNTGCQFIKGD